MGLKLVNVSVLIMLVCFVGLWVGGPAWSAAIEPVMLGGEPVIRVTATDELDASERAVLIKRRLEAVLAEDQIPRVTVQQVNGRPQLQVEDKDLLTVTTSDVLANVTTPEALAEIWSGLLEEALQRAYFERSGPGRLVAVLSGIGLTVAAWLLNTGLVWIRKNWLPVAPPQPRPISRATTRAVLTEALRLSIWPLHLTIWVGWFYLESGLFAPTRPLQEGLVAVLTGPLLSISLAVLAGILVIRLSYLLIDSLFEAIRDGQFLARDHSVRLDLRANTFNGVFKGTLTVIVIIALLVFILGRSGLDISPLLAGAGIVGLAVTLGAQSLIKDIINGFFILFEDQYGIGDVIVINSNANLGGLVEDLNLRVTRLRNLEGRLITVPNSEIKIVDNLSSRWSRVDLKIQVEYTADVDRVMAVMVEEARALRAEPGWDEKMIEEPEMLGVDAFTDAGITLRMLLKTAPLQQWEVDRAFRRRLKLAFDREGIRFAVTQRFIWVDKPSEPSQELAQLLAGRYGK
ncbi:MAG: mechanosensitive ion channel family protein [Gemmatimonadaceae bacterium]|nr:mechanosensitive ion channel family protein [Gloeobacterales cyanobacterium ES-bin-141]